MTAPTVVSARVGGLLYIGASVGFLVVFSWLASAFGYPDVLDHPAHEVLPNLLALGGTGRAMWVVYAILPLLLIPAAYAAEAALGGSDASRQRLSAIGRALQTVAAIAMTIGLARWSTAQWSLAEAWGDANAFHRADMTKTFDALNLYLGNTIGEFVGELALYSSFAVFALVLLRGGSRWMAGFGAVTGLFGLIGMFRNITPLVQSASDVTNILLPLFLIAFGVVVFRSTRRSAAVDTRL
jgi:hypothetical protein